MSPTPVVILSPYLMFVNAKPSMTLIPAHWPVKRQWKMVAAPDDVLESIKLRDREECRSN